MHAPQHCLNIRQDCPLKACACPVKSMASCCAAEKDWAEAEEKAEREAADKARAELEAAKQLEASKLGVATGQQDTTLADTAAEEQPHSQALDAQAPGASETAQAEAPAHTQPPADVPPVLADPVQGGRVASL